MPPSSWKFLDRYEFRVMDSLVDEPQFKSLVDELLGGEPPTDQLLQLSDEEKQQQAVLKNASKAAISLRLGVYLDKELIGACYAFQSGSSNFHMALSCVKAEHRRQGIYSELLATVLKYSKESGFQTVDSYHRATNNPVIIAKLRIGFVINGLTLTDNMGCLVKLTYFHSPERRKLMDARSGLARPEGLMRDLFF